MTRLRPPAEVSDDNYMCKLYFQVFLHSGYTLGTANKRKHSSINTILEEREERRGEGERRGEEGEERRGEERRGEREERRGEEEREERRGEERRGERRRGSSLLERGEERRGDCKGDEKANK
ncbi:hypothetical protein DUI87_05712 [Hirundo rustica rustica]|uniref:Uncharacterized protein n=1 Tax=Hirundo rustica rustica TaxID=333673 RepID=A0A3M0KVG7_HIRRU|nr:hypothetical protein DUI87_05712 [Hirundo rustica rustica]